MLRTGLIYSLVDICISVLFGPISKLFMHKDVIHFIDPLGLTLTNIQKQGIIRAEYRGSIVPVSYSGDLKGRVVSPVIAYVYFDSITSLLNYSTGFDLCKRDERKLFVSFDTGFRIGSIYTPSSLYTRI